MPSNHNRTKSFEMKGLLSSSGEGSKGKINVRKFISREYFKAALLPLLIIEVTLVAMYFFMSAYILGHSVDTLREDRFSHLMAITASQARNIDEQLNAVTELASVLKSTTTRFFQHPEQFPLVEASSKFQFSSNGVYYKRNNVGGSSLFYSKRNPIGQREKEKAWHSEALDPAYKTLFEANKNIVAVYLNTFDSMSRYYPYFKDVHEQLPSDIEIPSYNFYYLADKKHNPSEETVWTEAYLDPMGKGWMMSCLVPIYNDDFLEGVAGIDITTKKFIDSLLSLNLPWGSHALLVDSAGTIMAMPPEVERILGIDEFDEYFYQGKIQQNTHKPKSFNLLESSLAKDRHPVSELIQKKSGSITYTLDNHQYLLSQHTVLATGWKFMVIANETDILQPIARLEYRARVIGYAAIGFMCLFYIFFFIYLLSNTRKMSYRIAQPISKLASAIQDLASGNYQTKLETSDVAEIDELSRGFQSMSLSLKTLHNDMKAEVRHANAAEKAANEAKEALAEHKNLLEQTIEKRTREITQANHKLEEDISKRKRIEKDLDFERRQLLSIFDSIDEIVYISSPDTYELLYVNEAFKKFWPDIIGKKCFQVLQSSEEPCHFCTNSIIFGDKLGQPHIWEHRNLDTGRWYRCIDKAIQWPDGRMVRYEMAIDITEQKEATIEREQLAARFRRAEKMEALGTLAGGVAHDLNNILGGIVGYPELLLLKMSADNPFRKSLETIRDSGLRASAIVQDLLALARRSVTVMEPVNVNDIIDSFLRSPEYMQITSEQPNIRLNLNLCNHLFNCMGSAVHLTKMIMNLVANACEAMPDGGNLFISTDNQSIDQPIKGYDEVQKGDYTLIHVRDTGQGIEAEDLDQIFEPFYTKKKMGRSGTGLGMAVVWGTVKDHNGYIEINSNIGEGTTIDIYLPTTSKEATNMSQPLDISMLQGSKETVLVVDDDALQREIAVGMLNQMGYLPHAVSSGEAAIAYLEVHRVDVMLLDMIMDPSMDGLETYKKVIELHPGQKAIIVSGFSETAAVGEAQRLGAGNYLKKPYTINQLGDELKKLLG